MLSVVSLVSLFMDKTSSMYLLARLNRDAVSFPDNILYIQAKRLTFYKYRRLSCVNPWFDPTQLYDNSPYTSPQAKKQSDNNNKTPPKLWLHVKIVD